MNNSVSNLVLSVVISLAIIFGWHHFYEKPKLEKLVVEKNKQTRTEKSVNQVSKLLSNNIDSEDAKQQRITINSPLLSGSISLKGLRFDDLVLVKYKKDLSENSQPVRLFSSSGGSDSYFAEIGWIGNNEYSKLPDNNTIWKASSNEITPNNPVELSWTNDSNVEFIVKITLDDNYMFFIEQTTINHSNTQLIIQNYGLVNRSYSLDNNQSNTNNILHQGLVGTIDGTLQEYSYENVKDKKNQKFQNNVINWLGITDKYWLAAFVPDNKITYTANLNYANKSGIDKFQIDFVTKKQTIASKESFTLVHKLFAGAKKVDLLDKYVKEYNIVLFDRAIDFGWLYLLTKPMFNLLNFFYKYVGNFGVSILLLTVIIKMLLFSLANKSYRSMKKIKKLQPNIERIKKLYENDKMRLNKEIMDLYKRENANPLSGCLPLFVQIPVFFAIYKVLYVTIEMRQAPFFGWIKDLSVSDPLSVFNLFGLLKIDLPSFLNIGPLAIIMATTMFLQQKMSPEPSDPMQAKMMKFMPFAFLLMFGSFPAGLLIYWSWNNVLSILQQYFINKLDKDGK